MTAAYACPASGFLKTLQHQRLLGERAALQEALSSEDAQAELGQLYVAGEGVAKDAERLVIVRNLSSGTAGRLKLPLVLP